MPQLLPISGHAAQPERWSHLTDVIFRNMGPDNGLPHHVVTAIAEDGDGVLWFGNEDGLDRWDGFRLRTYAPSYGDPSALPDIYIQTLHTDHQGRLWIGTASGGLARYNRERDMFEKFGVGDHRLSHASVHAIADDGDEALWIGTEAGLDHLNVKTGSIDHMLPDPGDPENTRTGAVNAVLTDQDGTLWLGTATGLYRRTTGSQRFEKVALAGIGPTAPAILSLFEDTDRRIWVGTAGYGPFLLQGAKDEADPLTKSGQPEAALATETISSIVAAGPDSIWLGTPGHGLIEVERATLTVRHIRHDPAHATSLPHDFIYALAEGRNGMVWVGGLGGLSLYDTKPPPISTVYGASRDPEGIVDPDIHAILPTSDGHVWLGLGAKGIDIVDPLAGRVASLRPDPARPASALPEGYVNVMRPGPGGQIYIGTAHGLYTADLSGQHVARVPLPPPLLDTSIYGLLVENGELWLGSREAGLWHVDINTPGSARRYGETSLTDQRVRVIAPAENGKLWVGTMNGLNLFDPTTQSAEHILPDPGYPASLSGRNIFSFLTDRQRRLWVGTLDGGMSVLMGRDASGRLQFHKIGLSEGLPKADVGSLVMDREGRIWDSVAVIDPDDFIVRPLERSDGAILTTNWVGAGAITPQGELLFGAIGGLNVIRPERLAVSDYHPPLFVSDVRIGGRSVPAGALTIPSDGNSLSVEFAALDYSAPERTRYAYRLDGFDRDWIETDSTRRVAAYTNLPPGRYRLELRGSNRDGVWNETSLTLPVEVLPAWYQTWWFRTLMALLALAAVALLVRLRTAYLRRRQRELEHEVASRTRELQVLGDVGKEITSTLDTEQLFRLLDRNVEALLGADTFLVFGWQEGDGTLCLRYGMSGDRKIRGADIIVDEADNSAAAQAVARRQVIAIDQTSHDVLPFGRSEVPPGLSALAGPLISGERLIGAMEVHSIERRTYGAHDGLIFMALCSYAAIALDNTNAYRELSDSLREIFDKRNQVASLLDNSGEGFLSFGPDLVVDPEYSRACATLLGYPPAGATVDRLLFGEDEGRAEFFRAAVGGVMTEGDPARRALLLSLLPAELSRNGTVLKARYRLLENGHVMVVLTDITSETDLKRQVETEHKNLRMVVAAVSDTQDFFEVLDGFRAFYRHELDILLRSEESGEEMLAVIHRRVHTLKGILAQFDFIHAPAALHALEGWLETLDVRSAETIAATMRSVDYERIVEADLAVLRATLGDEFLTRGRQAHVSTELIEAIRGQAAALGQSSAVEQIDRLNRLVARLGAVRLRDTLTGFNRMIGEMAAKLGKEVAPLSLAGGEDIWLDPTIFGPFLRSLVHVFRNAVVHGIERPERREGLGKARMGQVSCRIESDGATLGLSIADDGGGMDLAALREKAGHLGLFPGRDLETVAEEQLYDALFRIGVSTYGTADDLAGRGVGLAALRSEVDGLGGAVRMRSSPNRGTECLISVPLAPKRE